jgi:hypothetical protein
MLFFALIATLPVLVDWRPNIGATLMTALHHLLLNFVAPALVFNGGDLAHETDALVGAVRRFEASDRHEAALARAA